VGCVVVKSIQLAKLQEQLQRGVAALNGVPFEHAVGSATEEGEEEAVGEQGEPPRRPAAKRTMVRKEARVAKVTLAVDRYIEANQIPCLRYDAASAEGGNPFDTVRPPNNFQLRAQMCGVDPMALVKCLYLLVTAPRPEGEEGDPALTLVRVVMPPVGYLDFDAISSALRVVLAERGCAETRLMLDRPEGRLKLEVASARALTLLGKGMGPAGEQCCTAEDLRQCAINYKICPPLGPPELMTLIAPEAAGDAKLLFEAGFGLYITVQGHHLATATDAIVVPGLIKEESTELPYWEVRPGE